MERSYEEKEMPVEINNEEILIVQRDVFSADTNYLSAKEAAMNKVALLEEEALRNGEELDPEKRNFILRAPIMQYIAERAPIFRFFAEHLSDPDALAHFKKAAESHDQGEIATILSLFEEFRVRIESSIAETDPKTWDSLMHAIEDINVHPELQGEIDRILEEYLNKSVTPHKAE